jgi:hypothetical protein
MSKMITLRLDEETEAWLRELSEKLGKNRTELLKMGVYTLYQSVYTPKAESVYTPTESVRTPKAASVYTGSEVVRTAESAAPRANEAYTFVKRGEFYACSNGRAYRTARLMPGGTYRLANSASDYIEGVRPA